jgi:hypothetical protein
MQFIWRTLVALILGTLGAYAQSVAPAANPTALVCAYNSSPPTITTGNFAYVQCDSSGKIIASGGGGGGSPGGANTDVQFNSSGSFGGDSGFTYAGSGVAALSASLAIGGATVPTNGAFAANYSPGANTATPAALIKNPNAATAGNQQFACNQLTGFGWKTTATAASQEVDWQVCNEPVQGTTNPTGNLAFLSNINAAGSVVNALVNSGGFVQSISSNGTGVGYLLTGEAIDSSTDNSNGIAITLNHNSSGNRQVVISDSVTKLGLRISAAGLDWYTAGSGISSILPLDSTISISSAILSGKSSSNIQHGAVDAAAPMAQTVSFQSVVAGTSNTAGALAKYSDSAGTGTGASGGFEFDVHPAGSSGSAQNAASAAFTLSGAGVPALPLLTTDATLTDATVCATTSGQILHFGSGTLGVCLGTSSARYKHDIEPIRVGLAQVMALQPKSYHLNTDHGDPAKLYYGFTAEQGGRVLPALMTRDDSGAPNTFDYLGLVPVLVAAIQQQQREIEKLEHRK